MTKRASKPRPPDAAEEFLEAVRDVTPLPDPGRVVHPRTPPEPIAQQRLKDDLEVLRDSLQDGEASEIGFEAGEELAYLCPGVSRQVLRKLRSGHWALQDTLDLHGLRWEESRTLLVQFIAQAVKRGHRCVLIIHGKGLRSQNQEPVLRGKVAGWLAQRAEVLAFSQARLADGGSGAVAVLLRGPKARPAAPEEDDDESFG
jgi:DNA-nicking Smr family endonuclease